MRFCPYARTVILVALTWSIAALVFPARADNPSMTMEGVVQLDTTNFYSHVGKDVPALVEFYAPWCGHCKNMVPELIKLGRAVATASDKVLVGKVDATQHGSLGEKFNVGGYPTILFFPAGSLAPETYKGQRDAAAFVSFLKEKVKDLNIFIPTEHKNVVELGSSNFDALALDPTKDAFVMFYAPWCGHCKKLHPVFETLAKIYKEEKDIVIASLNADDSSNARVRDNYKIDGFPTLVFFPKGKKSEPLYYDGSRSLEDLIQYVNEHTGKQRLASGELSSDAGVQTDIIPLLLRILDAKTDAEKQGALQEVEKAASAVGGGAGAQYPRIAQKLVQLGSGYIETELQRISRLMQSSLTGHKLDELRIRTNILNAIKKSQ